MTSNRLLFKNGFINYWILGSVLLVLRRHLHEAIMVNISARNPVNLQVSSSKAMLATYKQEIM